MRRIVLSTLLLAAALSACGYVVTRKEFMQTATQHQYVIAQPLQPLYRDALGHAQETYAQDSGAIVVDGQLYPDMGTAEIDVKVKIMESMVYYARFEFAPSARAAETVVTAYTHPGGADEYTQRQLDWFQERAE